MSNRKAKKYEDPYVGPYPIIRVGKNGNLTIHWGAIQECINIKCIKLYHKVGNGMGPGDKKGPRAFQRRKVFRTYGHALTGDKRRCHSGWKSGPY